MGTKYTAWGDDAPTILPSEESVVALPDGRVLKFKTGEQIMKDLRKRGMTAETQREHAAADKRRSGNLTSGLYIGAPKDLQE